MIDKDDHFIYIMYQLEKQQAGSFFGVAQRGDVSTTLLTAFHSSMYLTILPDFLSRRKNLFCEDQQA